MTSYEAEICEVQKLYPSEDMQVPCGRRSETMWVLCGKWSKIMWSSLWQIIWRKYNFLWRKYEHSVANGLKEMWILCDWDKGEFSLAYEMRLMQVTMTKTNVISYDKDDEFGGFDLASWIGFLY